MLAADSETAIELVRRFTSGGLDSFRDDVAAGRVDIGLKALDERGAASEIIREQYTGRYPLELIQNANDAAASTDSEGRVRFVLTQSALLVADQGAGFGPDQVRAICGLARSSKDPRKSIGYKGLGFKSVAEITMNPQVISSDLMFCFDAAGLRSQIELIQGSPLTPGLRVPDYAFPFEITVEELDDDRNAVDSLLSEGFRTIVRLPLRNASDRPVVEQHLVEALVPRLLLFLDATESLELEGTSNDFVAEAVRYPHEGFQDLLLRAGDRTENFLIFRREVPVEDRSLVEALGGAWREVEAVRLAVAVPLGNDGAPSGGATEPLHVYFPTEEQTGISLILNADFQMELDRRRLSRTAQAEAYNVWLLNQLADFLAGHVVPQLLEQFDGLGVLDVLASYGRESGWGEQLMQKVIGLLRERPIVPCRDSVLRTPSAARLLPASVPDPVTLHRWIGNQPATVVPGAEVSKPIRKLLVDRLGVVEVPIESVLTTLRAPVGDDVEDFYRALLDWSKAAPWHFASRLGSAQCVALPGGKWVRPNDQAAFLPPQRTETDFPSDLEVPIAQLPAIDGLYKLLESAGVPQLTWRALVADFLMPRLSNPGGDEGERRSALTALRTYYERIRRGVVGDQDIRDRVRNTLLPARKAAAAAITLRPAGTLYFGDDWIPNGGLETVYGPFNSNDFFALTPGITRDSDLEFFSWLGVSVCPKVVMVGEYEPTYADWRSSTEYRVASRCLSGGHPNSQSLDSARSFDRLPQILNSGSSNRLTSLWRLLVEHWPTYREHILHANWRCITSASHPQARNRPFPSPAIFLLRNHAWVPAEQNGKDFLSPPELIWRSTQTIPRHVVRHLLVPTSGLPRPGPDFAGDLGMLDSANLSAGELVAVLLDFEAEASDAKTLSNGVAESALWILSRIEEAAGVTQLEVGSVPLISRKDGAYIFDRHPVLVDNPIFAEVWRDAVAIYAGDRNLDRVLIALDIRNLDDQVQVETIHGDRQSYLEELVRARLKTAASALLALATRAVPSRRTEMASKLTEIGVVCSSEVRHKYALRGYAPRIDETASVFIDADGTAYLRSDGADPDWPSLALRLAEHLDVDSGDGFALLLTADERGREGFLRAHHISKDDLLAASVALDLEAKVELADDEPSPVAAYPEDSDQTRSDRHQFDNQTTAEYTAEVTQQNDADAEDLLQSHSDDQSTGPATRWPVQPADLPEADSATAAPITPSAPAGPRATTNTDTSVSRFFSYVVARGSTESRMAERADSEAMRIGARGVQYVVAHEAGFGRIAELQAHNNKGFDVISARPDGSERRVIEVKATAGAWPPRGVPVSKHQVDKNLELGDEFWLYVVEFAADPDRVRVIPIPNPVGAVDYFVFDAAWEQLAEATND